MANSLKLTDLKNPKIKFRLVKMKIFGFVFFLPLLPNLIHLTRKDSLVGRKKNERETAIVTEWWMKVKHCMKFAWRTLWVKTVKQTFVNLNYITEVKCNESEPSKQESRRNKSMKLPASFMSAHDQNLFWLGSNSPSMFMCWSNFQSKKIFLTGLIFLSLFLHSPTTTSWWVGNAFALALFLICRKTFSSDWDCLWPELRVKMMAWQLKQCFN